MCWFIATNLVEVDVQALELEIRGTIVSVNKSQPDVNRQP